MNLDGTFTFNGPRATVWTLLQDPEVLAKALPGTERLTLTSEDHFQGVMKVSVGPVTAAKFDVAVVLLDKVEPERFTMEFDGKGGVGFTKGTASISLADAVDGGTTMQYTSNIQIGGKIAAVGQRLVESVGRMMMRQALDALERELQARLSGAAEA